MVSNLVDFHCHLDLFDNYEEVLEESERQGIHTLTVTTTPKAWPRNYEIASKTHYVRAALGLHPQLITERAHEIQLWESYLPQARYIGEIGLDAGPKFYHSIEVQKLVFERILLKCNDLGGKILTIHSVRSIKAVLDMIEKIMSPDRNRIVLHWFTGSRSEARRATDLGCYFSINYQMMQNERNRNMIATLPIDRILTETDGPFCQYGGSPIHPKDVLIVTELIAKILEQETEETKGIIISNLNALENI